MRTTAPSDWFQTATAFPARSPASRALETRIDADPSSVAGVPQPPPGVKRLVQTLSTPPSAWDQIAVALPKKSMTISGESAGVPPLSTVCAAAHPPAVV